MLVPSVNSFPILISLFFIWGASITLISGAYDAWVIDLLEKKLPDTDPRIRIALAKTVAYKTLKDKEVKLERLIVEALNGK